MTSIKRLQAEERKRTRETKEVRIDAKTVICVPVNISDDEARANFMLKLQEVERRRSTKYDRTRNAIQKSMEP